MEVKEMQFINFLRSFYKDERGQDLVEYAMMAGFVAVAAGTFMPVAPGIVKVFVDAPHATIRMVCAVLAVALLVLIVLRRRRRED